MATRIDKEKTKKTIADILDTIKTEADPRVLNEYRAIFKKEVSLFRRSWAAAYLLMLFEQNNAGYRGGRDKAGKNRKALAGTLAGTQADTRAGAQTDARGDMRADTRTDARPAGGKQRKRSLAHTHGGADAENRGIAPDNAGSADESGGESRSRQYPLAEEDSRRIFISIGRNRRVFPREILGLIIAKTGVSRDDIGAIRILENYSFVQVRTTVSEQIIEAVAEALMERNFPLVVDPVCVSQTGHRLLQEEAVKALRRRILPLANLLTPNRPEAELLADLPIHSVADVAEAGRRLLDMGAEAVLIKGGHFAESRNTEGDAILTDWLCLPDQNPLPLTQPYVHTTNNHGTGCTLSAAIATWLGQGMPLAEAIVLAQRYLNRCLQQAYAPGKGVGPVNHAAPFVHLYPIVV